MAFSAHVAERSMEVFALASGSSGNAMLVRAGNTRVLIDAGVPLRNLAVALRRRGISAHDLDAILLTHEHTDHSCSASAIARRGGTPIIGSPGTLAALSEREELPFSGRELETGDTVGIGCIGVRSFPVPHDAQEPVGFVLEAGETRITYCTDLGSVTDEVRRALEGAKLAILEANHDVDWLWRGPYTDEMKERVASPTGHLSNLDCADLIAERLEIGGPLTVWLAHLSRVNNSPALAQRTVLARLAQQTRIPVALQVALRDHPSVVWRAGAQAVQLSLL